MLLFMFIATFLVAIAIGFLFASILSAGRVADDQHDIMRWRDAYTLLGEDLTECERQNAHLHTLLDEAIDGNVGCPSVDSHAAIIMDIIREPDITGRHAALPMPWDDNPLLDEPIPFLLNDTYPGPV